MVNVNVWMWLIVSFLRFCTYEYQSYFLDFYFYQPTMASSCQIFTLLRDRRKRVALCAPPGLLSALVFIPALEWILLLLHSELFDFRCKAAFVISVTSACWYTAVLASKRQRQSLFLSSHSFPQPQLDTKLDRSEKRWLAVICPLWTTWSVDSTAAWKGTNTCTLPSTVSLFFLKILLNITVKWAAWLCPLHLFV